jgi:shikimate dehydrogenase
MKPPTVKTRFVALLGNPLGHSVSPPMHNRVFNTLGMDFLYFPIEVTDHNLETVFRGLSKMNVAGCNVTIPHKIKIMEYLDELDPLAETIGAVNTICFKDGKSKGYNTDGEGFVRSLEEESGIDVRGKNFFVIGCGGSSRAICMTLAAKGANNVFITNRTKEKAVALSNEINNRIKSCSSVASQVFEEQLELASQSDVIINTTSLGMHPGEDRLPLDERLITADHIVADIVYNPRMTQLLVTAKNKGAKIVPGLGMLVYQGAAAFELFTGVSPLISEMMAEVKELMAG